VTCDTLEHVAPAERRGFLGELLRASREYVVLIAPFYQQETLLADRILDLYITRTLGVVHLALREHLQAELPRSEELRGWLEEAGLAYVDFPSGYVHHWLLMMMAKHYLLSLPDTLEMQRTLDVFYNQHLSDADERAPAYRHVFVVSMHGLREPLLDIKKDHDQLSSVRSEDDPPRRPPFLELLLHFLQLEGETEAERDLRQQIIDKDLRISHLEALAAEKESQIADQRRILNEYHEHLTVGQAKLQHAEAKLAEYVEALEEAKERLETYHESLTACMRNLEQTTEVLERFKKGRVVSAMMKAQELVRKIRGPLGV
ncbi:MAG: hypothetical protein Q8O76_06150, partial [Chloroflexota bacterium]|nr:hypothetical protein [Chloroflexota bacterium]